MYVVRKCEDWQGQGKCSWKTIFTSPTKEGAFAIFKQEYKLILEADYNLDRKTIDNRVDNSVGYYETHPTYYRGGRIEAGHGEIGFAVYKSHAAEYQDVPKRPDRTELLDSILG